MPTPTKSTNTTALVSTKTPRVKSIAVHAPPTQTTLVQKHSKQHSLTKDILHFGSAMFTHNRMVLSGSAFAAVVQAVYSILEKTMPSRVAIGLFSVLLVFAIFNAWRAEHHKRIDADLALEVADGKIHALENPDIRIKTNHLRVTNSSGSDGQWIWTLELSVQVIPPHARHVTFSDLCESALTEPGAEHGAVYFRFTEFISPMGLPRSPIDITDAMTIVCRARTAMAPWPEKPGGSLDVVITLADARTNWRTDITIQVHADPIKERCWIGV